MWFSFPCNKFGRAGHFFSFKGRDRPGLAIVIHPNHKNVIS
jgi:hypothetical protein